MDLHEFAKKHIGDNLLTQKDKELIEDIESGRNVIDALNDYCDVMMLLMVARLNKLQESKEHSKG